MDVDAIKQRQAQTWGLGDYELLSRQLAPAAQQLCDSCAVSAGQEVLDVAAGDGNFALAAAREGASVVASDISPGMVERGRARAAAEGYDIEWVEADVEALPFEDERFDCVGSCFGAFLAPRPDVASRELLRVVRPGGTVGMTTWTPEGIMAEQFAVNRSFAPPEPDLVPSERWGDEATARERLEPLFARVEFERHTIEWAADSAEEFVSRLSAAAPPMVAARRALGEERFEEMSDRFKDLFTRWNSASDGSLRIEAEYAVIVARRRG